MDIDYYIAQFLAHRAFDAFGNIVRIDKRKFGIDMHVYVYLVFRPYVPNAQIMQAYNAVNTGYYFLDALMQTLGSLVQQRIYRAH